MADDFDKAHSNVNKQKNDAHSSGDGSNFFSRAVKSFIHDKTFVGTIQDSLDKATKK